MLELPTSFDDLLAWLDANETSETQQQSQSPDPTAGAPGLCGPERLSVQTDIANMRAAMLKLKGSVAALTDCENNIGVG